MDVSKRIAQLVQEACILEVCAPKPGNVNRDHDFCDTRFEDYLLSAVAVGPAFENTGQGCVGRIVRQAAMDCRRRVKTNTNLGIILLLAPLAEAYSAFSELHEHPAPVDFVEYRKVLHRILHSLTVEDAKLVYASVRSVMPGGIGEVPDQDIAKEPVVTLLQAMDLAKDRDSIASEYVTDFEITFTIGFPSLKDALSRGLNFSDAIVSAFLAVLSRVPDTLIARKNGSETALRVSQRAEEVMSYGGIHSSRGREKLQELDRYLRDASHKLNPGTTADLIAAAVFLVLIEMRVH